MIKFGISPEDWSAIIQAISSEKKIQEIVLFGSRAKGNFKTGSDIDIALKGDKISLIDQVNISALLDELELPYKFDLVIFDRIQEPKLTDYIQRVGISLYKR